MKNKLKTYGFMMIAAVLLIAMAFAGAASADPEPFTWSDDFTEVTFTGFGDSGALTPDIVKKALAIRAGKHPELAEEPFTAIIGDGVTEITTGAFAGCQSLESVKLMSGITTIGEKAFADCRNLSSVDAESAGRLAYIGAGAFANCINLEKIILPKNVETIKESVFEGCTNLTLVELKFRLLDKFDTIFSGPNSFAGDANAVVYLDHNGTKPDFRTWKNEEKIEHLVLLNGGSLKSGYTQNGLLLPDETAVEKPGYTFGGWYTLDGATYKEEEIGNDPVCAMWTPDHGEFKGFQWSDDGSVVTFYGAELLPNKGELEMEIADAANANRPQAALGTPFTVICDGDVMYVGDIFAGDNNLTTVVLTNLNYYGGKYLSKGAFADCKNLTKVVIDGCIGYGLPPREETLFKGTNPIYFELTYLPDEEILSNWINQMELMGRPQPVWYIDNGELSDRHIKPGYFVASLNGGKLTDTYNFEYNGKCVLPTDDNLTKTGYLLNKTANWYLINAYGERGPYLEKSFGPEIIPIANWDPITYFIVFDANGGSGTTNALTCTYDVESVLSANNFTRSGYSFTGWNTKKDGSGTPYTDEAVVMNLTAENATTITMYAQWKQNAVPYTPTHHETGSTVILQQDTTSVVSTTPTPTPTATPTPVATPTPATPTVIATAKPTTQPTQASPAPLAGLIAGLGAAAVLLRMRK